MDMFDYNKYLEIIDRWSISEGKTLGEVREILKKIMIKTHPDKNLPTSNEAKFKAANSDRAKIKEMIGKYGENFRPEPRKNTRGSGTSKDNSNGGGKKRPNSGGGQTGNGPREPNSGGSRQGGNTSGNSGKTGARNEQLRMKIYDFSQYIFKKRDEYNYIPEIWTLADHYINNIISTIYSLENLYLTKNEFDYNVELKIAIYEINQNRAQYKSKEIDYISDMTMDYLNTDAQSVIHNCSSIRNIMLEYNKKIKPIIDELNKKDPLSEAKRDAINEFEQLKRKTNSASIIKSINEFIELIKTSFNLDGVASILRRSKPLIEKLIAIEHIQSASKDFYSSGTYSSFDQNDGVHASGGRGFN